MFNLEREEKRWLKSSLFTKIICIFLGATVGFGVSYAVFQPQIDALQLDLSVSFESELSFYQNSEGFVIYDKYSWDYASGTYNVPLIQVSREILRLECEKSRGRRNYCDLSVDLESEVIWVNVRDFDGTCTTHFVYYWSPNQELN